MKYLITIQCFRIITVILAFLLTSCSEKSNDNQINKDEGINNEEMITLNEDDFEESDEDLLMVDYNEFYSELAPHGEWIEVTGKELELDFEKGSASSQTTNRSISLAKLFGIKEAYAGNDEFGSFFIWKPSPNLAVSIENEPVEYTPFFNGQWVNTDAGWYFKAPTPAEEIIHHFGRWVSSPALGWVWVPGRVWSPAWVDWKENDNYIAWAPIPPKVYIVNNSVNIPVIPEDKYVKVEKKYFVQPSFYKYSYKENKNKIMIKDMRKINGVMVINKTIINKGPDVSVIERIADRKLEVVTLRKVKTKNEFRNKGDEIEIFTPHFKKIKTREKVKIVSKPGKFVKFEEEENKNKRNGKFSEQEKGKNNSQEEESITKGKNFTNDKSNGKGKDKVEQKVKSENKGKDNDNGNENKSKGSDGKVNKGNDKYNDYKGDKNQNKVKGGNNNNNNGRAGKKNKSK